MITNWVVNLITKYRIGCYYAMNWYSTNQNAAFDGSVGEISSKSEVHRWAYQASREHLNKLNQLCSLRCAHSNWLKLTLKTKTSLCLATALSATDGLKSGQCSPVLSGKGLCNAETAGHQLQSLSIVSGVKVELTHEFYFQGNSCQKHRDAHQTGLARFSDRLR